jgi:hypothetical protein
MQAVTDFTDGNEDRSAQHDQGQRGFDPWATELSPSLLAIEAELRGIRIETGKAEELQREIYQELAQKPPPIGPEESR